MPRSLRQTIRDVEAQGRTEDLVYDDILQRYSSLTGIDWEEVPVDIKTFVEDQSYSDFGPFMWPEVMLEAEAILRGHELGIREAVLEWAIGTGKSTLASLLATYFVYRLLCIRDPQKHYAIAPDDYITVLNMSRNAGQARKIVFKRIGDRAKNSRWFRSRGYLPDPEVKSELRFPKSIVVLPGNSSQTFALGYNIIYAVLDEANFYTDKSGLDNALDIYDTMQRRVSSRFSDGMIVGISSTTTDDSFTRGKEKELAGQLQDGIVPSVHYSTRTIVETKPNIGPLTAFEHRGSLYNVPVLLLTQCRRNPDKALRDYMCVTSSVDAPYMPPYDWLKGTCEAGENSWDDGAVWPRSGLRPVMLNEKGESVRDGRPRYIHVDLGMKKDACGFAMVCLEGRKKIGPEPPAPDDPKEKVKDGREARPVIRVDLAARILPKQMGGEIDFAQVRQIIYELQQRGYNIAGVSYDGFASEESLQQLQRRGYKAKLLSVDKNMAPYEQLKEAAYERRLLWKVYEPLLRELSRLQNDVKRRVVDHPAGGSKDVADALAGAAYTAVHGGQDIMVTWA